MHTDLVCFGCGETPPSRYIKLVNPCGCLVCADCLLRNNASRGASSLICSCGIRVSQYFDHQDRTRSSIRRRAHSDQPIEVRRNETPVVVVPGLTKLWVNNKTLRKRLSEQSTLTAS
jgi:hypothetical protein